MSLFVDQRYMYLLSPRLDLFRQKKDNLWNFRCPICNDSKKNKLKARAYVYALKGNLLFRCHNCGHSCSLGNLIKQLDPRLYKEYQLDRYKEEAPSNVKKPDFSIAKSPPVFRKSLGIPTISSLSVTHPGRTYVEGRLVPAHRWSELYYTDNFKEFVQSLVPTFDTSKMRSDDPRVVIPFYDQDNNLLGFQGRGIKSSQIRYITIKMSEDLPKIFGLNRVDFNRRIIVTEGPFDAMFLSNALAVMDANLASVANTVKANNFVLVFDNEPRNREIVKYMERAIEADFAVCIWPSNIREKDINDMVRGGYTPEQVEYIIDQNTFVNLKAKLQFNMWRKV
jgi:hypothetical protein